MFETINILKNQVLDNYIVTLNKLRIFLHRDPTKLLDTALERFVFVLYISEGQISNEDVGYFDFLIS
jgi:hypothetical protein